MSGIPAQPAKPLFSTHEDENTAFLSLGADLVQPAACQVRGALLDLLATRPKRLVVDMTSVRALDDMGLGALLVVALWARKSSVEFVLIPSPIARDRLTTDRLDGYLTFVEPGSIECRR
jgi:anti-anti-sigma regulatory factor